MENMQRTKKFVVEKNNVSIDSMERSIDALEK